MAVYDSRPDTYEHRMHVQLYMLRVVNALLARMVVHDASKLVSPEREVFDAVSQRLNTLTYGSPEYKASLAEMKDGLRHHYDANPHHPEHYADGIVGMSLVDLIEMACDWAAAGLRHDPPTGLARSIGENQERFGYSDELRAILLNTAQLLENGDEATRRGGR
jgi:hypothetical protein